MEPSENQFRALVENSPEAIYVAANGTFLYLNPAAVRLFGANSADELIGQPCMERIHPDYHAVVTDRIRHVVDEKINVAPLEEVYVRLNGEPVDVEVSAVPFRYGDLDGGLIFFRDITERKKAEAELRTQAERHSTLLATTGDGFWICDLQGRLLEVNDAFARMTGYSREELLNLTISDIEAVETPEDTAQHIRKVLTTGFDRFESRHRRKSGEVYDVEILSSYWATQEKLLVFTRDITEQKKAEAELRKSRELLRSIAISKVLTEAMGIGIIGVNAEHRVVFANPYAQHLLGTTEGYMLGHLLDDVVRAATDSGRLMIDSICPDWSCIDNGDSFQTEEWSFTRHDGSRFPVSLVIAPILDNSVPAQAVLSFHDITDRKHAEQALLDADRRKDEFVAMLAHELRNPLAPICNAAFILGSLGLHEPKVTWAQEVIERQVGHLSRLVDELLDISRIVRGKIEIKKEPLDIATLVEQVAATAQPWFDKRSQQFIVNMPSEALSLNGDIVRLSQVLLNLLDNASKYTPEGGAIELNLSAHGHEIEIRVKDTGQGIPAELLPHVFDLFQQGERTPDRAQGGLGIGLTLVQQLIEMHGGKVVAQSAGVGLGSTLTVRLPLASNITAPATQEQPPEHATSSARTLVVDDDPDVASSMATLLDIVGYEVAIAPGGQTALEMVPIFLPQAVLLDIGLKGGMDGFETAKQMRQLQQGAKLFLVAVTGYADENTRIKAIESGCDYYFAKPIEPQVLLELLSRQMTTN